MPEAGDRPARPRRTWLPMVLWTAAILAALGLAWVIGAVVVPYFQARAAVRAVDPTKLGTPRQAARKLSIYLRFSQLVPGEREHRPRACSLLGEAGPEAVPALVAALADSDALVRRWAFWTLAEIGPAAKEVIPALAAALKDPEAAVRVQAALALGKIGPEAREAVPALVAALADPDMSVSSVAGMALKKIGPEAVPALAAALKELRVRSVRLWAASVLAGIGPEAVPVLSTALKDSDADVREGAAMALGWIGPEAREAIPALEALLKDEDEDVRAAAKIALEKIRVAAPEPEPEGRNGVRHRFCWQVGQRIRLIIRML